MGARHSETVFSSVKAPSPGSELGVSPLFDALITRDHWLAPHSDPVMGVMGRKRFPGFASRGGQADPAFGVSALPAFRFFFRSFFASLAILASCFLAFSFLRLVEIV